MAARNVLDRIRVVLTLGVLRLALVGWATACLRRGNTVRCILAGGRDLIRRSCPWLHHVFADGGYAGPKLRGALDRIGEWTIEIVKRSDTAKGFEVLPRRWVVERTFA